jgi:hypothetical protein
MIDAFMLTNLRGLMKLDAACGIKIRRAEARVRHAVGCCLSRGGREGFNAKAASQLSGRALALHA